MRVSYVISAWAVTLTALVATAGAQGRGGRAEMATFNSEVTVMTVTPRALQVTTADRENWLVTIPTRPEDVVFRGTATPQFLQPGMAVRFHATFKKTDKRRKEYQATRPVSQLEIISITENSPPGLYPDDGSADGDHPAGQDVGDDEGRGAEVEKKEAEKKEEDEHAAGEELACLVIGILREYKNNKIKVSAGQFPITAELPETVDVSVDVRHALWVRPGDKIELNARYLPAMRGRAEGQRMTITAAAPLAPDETAAKGRRRTRDKKPDEAPKKVEVQGEPKNDAAKKS